MSEWSKRLLPILFGGVALSVVGLIIVGLWIWLIQTLESHLDPNILALISIGIFLGLLTLAAFTIGTILERLLKPS